jgi:hypothetical protein
MRLEPFNQSHLELALLEVALADDTSPVSPPAGRQSLNAPSPPRSMASPPAVQAIPAGDAEGRIEVTPPPIAQEVTAPVSSPPAEPAPRAPEAGGSLDLETVSGRWPRILREIASEASTVGIVLQAVAPVDVSGRTVIFGFEKALWGKKVEQPRVRNMLEDSLSRDFGTEVHVQFRLGAKPDRRKPAGARDAVVEAAVRELGFEVVQANPTGADQG